VIIIPLEHGWPSVRRIKLKLALVLPLIRKNVLSTGHLRAYVKFLYLVPSFMISVISVQKLVFSNEDKRCIVSNLKAGLFTVTRASRHAIVYSELYMPPMRAPWFGPG
jgi:hypothetical protein